MTNAASVTIIPISQLPEADTPLVGTEQLPIVQDQITKRVAASDLAAAVLPTFMGTDGVDIDDTTPGLIIVGLEDGGIENASLADMAEATIKGRADGAGTGPPQDLTAELAADIIWDDFDTARREDNDVGYLSMPPLGSADGNVLQSMEGSGVVVSTAVARALTLQPQATVPLPSGFIATFAVVHAGGSITITAGVGVTITNLANGDTGSFEIVGFGIATLWRLSTNQFAIHGTNVEQV